MPMVITMITDGWWTSPLFDAKLVAPVLSLTPYWQPPYTPCNQCRKHPDPMDDNDDPFQPIAIIHPLEPKYNPFLSNQNTHPTADLNHTNG